MIRQIVPHKATGADCVTVIHAVDQRWTTVDGQLQRASPRLTKLITEDGDRRLRPRPAVRPVGLAARWRRGPARAAGHPRAAGQRLHHPRRAQARLRRSGRGVPPLCGSPRRHRDVQASRSAVADGRAGQHPVPAWRRPDRSRAGRRRRPRALPPEFRSARCGVQLSSGAGHQARPPGAPVVLARPPDQRRRGQALAQGRARRPRGLPARPGALRRARRSSPGVDDPCFDGRLAFLPGYAEVAVPDLPDPERPRAAFVPDSASARAPVTAAPRRTPTPACAASPSRPRGAGTTPASPSPAGCSRCPRPGCSIRSASPVRSRASWSARASTGAPAATSARSTRSSSGLGRPSSPKGFPDVR